jgi:hypothetical protein
VTAQPVAGAPQPGSALLSLDDPRALDLRQVGAKAARLARARTGGLPVLPGVIVPVEHARPSIDQGLKALDTGGSGAARLAVMAIDPEAAVLAELGRAATEFARPLIVRSSSPVESGGAWSGAFSTFEDVTVDQLSTALRGVWASMFTVQALERFEATGTDPHDAGMAVLVQPQVKPSCGGVATVREDGTVDVVATDGRLAELVAGWATGERATVTASGGIRAADAPEPFGQRPFAAAAALARDVHELLGDDGVEWAVVDDEVVLLQSTRSARPRRPDRHPRGHHGIDDPIALRIAAGAAWFPDVLGEELVLPWWPAADGEVARPAAHPSAHPIEDLDAAVALAAALTEEAWADQGGTARARATLRRVRGHRRSSITAFARLRPVPAAAGERLVELVEGVAAAAVASGLTRTADAVWRHPPRRIRAWFEGSASAPSPALGPGTWEPFVYATLMAAKRPTPGIAAAPGIGAGRVTVVRDPHAPPAAPGRAVVVAPFPVPALAPMLWGAAGLVTLGGNPGAHLVEVARSLGVPAVVGVGEQGATLGEFAGSHAIAAVDGDGGGVVLHS